MSAPQSTLIESDHVSVRFHSDGAISHHGYKADFIILPLEQGNILINQSYSNL